MKLTRLLLPLMLSPGLAFAGPWDGTYRQGAADCARFGVEGGAIRIEGDMFFGNEAICEMRQPVEVRNMNATLYDMYCEGYLDENGAAPQPWEARTMIMRAADGGLYMVWDGFAFQFDKCTAEELVEELIGEQPEDPPETVEEPAAPPEETPEPASDAAELQDATAETETVTE